VLVPGAIDAELGDALFWWSLGGSLTSLLPSRRRSTAG
jgi:hypothetical protein